MAKKKLEENTQLDEVKASAPGYEVADPVAKSNKGNAVTKNAAAGDQAMPKLDDKGNPLSKVEVINWVIKNIAGGADAGAAFLALKKAWDAKQIEVSKNTVAAKSIVTKEDVDAVFDGTEISEEVKSKAADLFESAVEAKVALRVQEIEEENEAKVSAAILEATDELVSKLDSYLDYVAEQYVEANKLAIQEGLRAEIAESFLTGLKSLFENHYVEVPEEKVDVVESLSDRVAELEEKLNEALQVGINLKAKLDESEKAAALAKLSEGLTETQKEKFATLAEGVDYSDLSDFTAKIEVIKESHFADAGKKVLTEDALNDGPVDVAGTKPAVVDPEIAAIAAAMSRVVKR